MDSRDAVGSPAAEEAEAGRAERADYPHSGQLTAGNLHVNVKRLEAAVVFAVRDDLNALGADRLRACPLEKDGNRCGKVFVAKRRQLFCTREHAVAAAWQRFEPKRKAKR
jgi:hypothetical protein